MKRQIVTTMYNNNDNWKASPNHYLEKHGGLPFLLKCNYDIKYEILSYGTTRRFLLTRSQ